jgi:hypothetical protein
MRHRKRENKKGTFARIARYKFSSNKKGSRQWEPFSFAGASVGGVLCCREKQFGHGAESVPLLVATRLLVDLHGDARVRVAQQLLDRLHILF